MEKNYIIQLTKDLYKFTLLFPKKEPLRYKMRELADDILSGFFKQTLEKYIGDTYATLEVLDSFFEVAKEQNWTSPAEISLIQQEYNKLSEQIKNNGREGGQLASDMGSNRNKEPVIINFNPIPVGPSALSEKTSRQQKILEILREKGRVQAWQLKQVFPTVSKRTLRRDFEDLVNQGAITRVGERNDTFYVLAFSSQEIQPA